MAAEAHACRKAVASLNWLLAIKVVPLALAAVTLLRSAYCKKIAAIFCRTGLIV